MIGNLTLSDNLIIFIYFAIVLFIGILGSRGKDQTAKDYFLAGRNMGWFIIGASLFATNISSEHLVGLAGAGSVHGLSVGHFEWLAVIILFFLGWVFAPVFLRSNVYTMPEYLGKRYNQNCRKYLAIISLAAYFFTKIAVTLLAGGYLLNKVLGLDMFSSVVMLVLLTGLYTVIGGLNSVMKTHVFQTIVLVLGSLCVTIFGLVEVGGFSGLTSSLPSDYFSVFKSVSDPEFPWTGILFGAPILGIWYWCTDQYIVQRILSAKGIEAARKGTLFAAFLKILPLFLFVLPGLIAAVLYPQVKGDEAFTLLISGELLPNGIKGFVIAGLFAALMSSLASAFNSSATLITIDFFKPRKPTATDNELVLVGRLSTTLVVLLAIVIIPLLKMVNNHIYLYLQNIQAYISPPIASVFIIGILWSKATGKGAFWALMTGGTIGIIKIALTFLDDSIINTVAVFQMLESINYLHFAIFLFLISTVILVVVSLVDKKTISEKFELENLMIHQKDLRPKTANSYIKHK
ncbi:sodium:solute symporter [Bacteroidota bacterium]